MNDQEWTYETSRKMRLSRVEDSPRRRALLGGGTDGNELLTTANGAILIALLGALGMTILFIGQLLPEHFFVGIALIGPVGLKLSSTGYRFVRYYSGDSAYQRKGPPPQLLRLLAPLLVALTLSVLATGVLLLIVGPAAREPWLLLHKASFILWLGVMSIHVLGHLPEVGRLVGLRPGADGPTGSAGRGPASGAGDASTGVRRPWLAGPRDRTQQRAASAGSCWRSHSPRRFRRGPTGSVRSATNGRPNRTGALSACVFDGARLADHGDLDLTGVLQLLLYLTGDLVREQ